MHRRRPAAFLAAGLPNGSIVLANFREGRVGDGESQRSHCALGAPTDETFLLDMTGSAGARNAAVNSLSWNPAKPGRLAAGMDRRQRGDGGVLVWDVEYPASEPFGWVSSERRTGANLRLAPSASMPALDSALAWSTAGAHCCQLAAPRAGDSALIVACCAGRSCGTLVLRSEQLLWG